MSMSAAELASESRASRTAQLEARVKQLEEQVDRAEQAEQLAAKQASDFTAAVLSGKVDIGRAPVQPLVSVYPSQKRNYQYPAFLKINPVESAPGYVCAVPRDVIHTELRHWNQADELSIQLRLRLLHVFLPHRDQFNFDLCIPRLELRITHESDHPDAFHPCLINAIALAACSCAGPDLREFEQVFLERTKKQCEVALANVDRLEHFMWASVVLGWYWTRVGKIPPAHSLSNTVAHWAIACELHCISNPPQYIDSGEAGLLGPVKDVIHFAERVNLWWAIFILDRRVALATGLQPVILPETRAITTVWPRSCESIRLDASPSLWGRESVNDLFVFGTSSTNLANDSLLCIRAKTGALLDRAMWLSYLSTTPSGANSYWTVYISLDTALEQMAKTIPEITDQREIQVGEVGKRLNPSLVLARAYVDSAMIIIHKIDAEKSPVAREKCLAASKRMARDVQQLSSTYFLYSHACLGPCWLSGAEVCLREIQRLTPPGNKKDEEALRLLHLDLDSYIRGLTWLTSHFPGLILYIRKLGTILYPESDPMKIQMIQDLPAACSVASSTYSSPSA